MSNIASNKYYGLNGKAFIDLDKFLPVEDFQDLHTEICAGIALSDFSPSGFWPDIADDSANRAPEYYKKFASPEEKEYLEKINDYSKQRIFYKFYKNAYVASSSLYLKKPKVWNDKNKEENCYWTESAVHFPKLKNFIEKLPFKEFGRIMLFLLDEGKHTPVHREYPPDGPHDFIWIRNIKMNKPFYIADKSNNEKSFVSGSSCWFNENDYHGTAMANSSCYSLRVDGKFHSDFRKKILCN